MVPPSFTVGEAARLTVVTLTVSGTVVEAAAVLKARLSKVVPPETAVMLREVVPASIYGSSPGAATAAVPLVCPEAIITVYRTTKKGSNNMMAEREPVAVISNVKGNISVALDDVPEGAVNI